MFIAFLNLVDWNNFLYREKSKCESNSLSVCPFVKQVTIQIKTKTFYLRVKRYCIFLKLVYAHETFHIFNCKDKLFPKFSRCAR